MARRVPTIASRALRKLPVVFPHVAVEACREAGFDLATCDDPEARVPLATLHALWEAVHSRERRPDVALVSAMHYVPGDYALLGFVCMNSATLGEAIRHTVRYLRLWTEEPSVTLVDDGLLRLSYSDAVTDRHGLHLATEATFAEMLHGARQLAQAPVVAQSVAFSHPAPPSPHSPAAHDAFFGTRVQWNRPRAEMRLSPETLAMPVPHADPQLGAFLWSMANEALARRDPPSSLREELRNVLAEELSKGVPSLDALARRMATSSRTLRRRLDAEGTTFRDLLDETRAELARGYVSRQSLPLCEVAFLLGFSEPSAFHRAFKRWTGSTPASFRLRATATA